MIIFRNKISVMIQISRSKKLPKILEIREIREKTTIFIIFRLFFSNLSDCLALKKIYVYFGKNKSVII